MPQRNVAPNHWPAPQEAPKPEGTRDGWAAQDDPTPWDWSKLGRRVLAEALRRARDELADRQATTASPAAHPTRPEKQS